MARYKWTSNKDSQDGTEIIVLESGEKLRLNEEAELSEEEVSQLRQRHNLREVDSQPSDAGAEAGASEESSEPAASNSKSSRL
jgi:hypothetical protein